MNENIILDDCMNQLKTFKSKSIDLVITDIPYNNINRKTNGLRQIDKGVADSAIIDLPPLLIELKRITKGSIYIFCEFNQVSEIRRLLETDMSTRIIVWEKTNPSPMNGDKIWLSGIELCIFAKFPNALFNGHCRIPVLKYKTVRSKLHPTEKPQELLIDIIETSSKEGDLILDPFAGSGSTAIACLKTKRRFICIEKEPTYYNIILERVKSQLIMREIS